MLTIKRKNGCELGLFIALVVCFTAGTALGQSPVELFSATAGQGSGAGGAGITRTREVTVEMSLLSGLQPGDTRTLNFFNDASYVGVFARQEFRSTGSYSWAGSIQGISGGWFVLAVEGDVTAVNAWVPGTGTYHVRYDGGGMHVSRETDLTVLSSEDDVPIPDPDPALCRKNGKPDCPSCVPDDGALIDMLVVYTVEARTEAKGNGFDQRDHPRGRDRHERGLFQQLNHAENSSRVHDRIV